MIMSDETKTYRVFRGNERIWLVSNAPDCAHDVYCTHSLDPNQAGTGFGGKTVSLPLEGGGVFRLNGGWHSNAGALLSDTGVDVKAHHATRAWYGLGYDIDQGFDHKGLIDVFEVEGDYILGQFNRAEERAQLLANSRKQIIHGWVESRGGGHGFVKEPENKESNETNYPGKSNP